jgi:hypothetical protein
MAGRTTRHGYGAAHQKLRAQLAPIVATGLVRCWRCRELISARQRWDLGHDRDRRYYRGPEHVHCNRATATHAEWVRRGRPGRITHVTARPTATAKALDWFDT